MQRFLLASISCFLLVCVPLAAQEEDDKTAETESELSITQHQVTIDGKTLDYTATAGYMEIPAYEGEAKADVFFMAYTLDGVEEVSDRPITFCFNGGPGSSSVWLHLGTIGPRRVVMGDADGAQPAPPYSLVENDESWLGMTDLVFIDPVGTGYSRPKEGESKDQFHGLEEDIRSVGTFIRLYTTKYTRWGSPKYLAGESYGTTRAAGLSSYLQDTHGMNLSGIAFISPVLNFQSIRFAVGNDLPYWMFLPTYTATAWYHGQLGDDLQEDLEATLDKARRFAQTDYLLALARGDTLTNAEKSVVISELARFTGLSERFIEGSNLRINISNFVKELLRDEGRTVGRLDSRFKGIDRTDIGSGYEYDPSYAAIQGVYTAMLNDYVRTELEYESDLPYEILTGRVRPWSYSGQENRYANVAERLRKAMTKNPALRIFFASGYYDLATPFFAMEYTVSHMELDESLRSNISRSYYESGHMMYVRLEDLATLRHAVRKSLFEPVSD